MKIIRGARVEVQPKFDQFGNLFLVILFDKYFQIFGVNSKESQMYIHSDKAVVERYFNGGTFLVDDTISPSYNDLIERIYNGGVTNQHLMGHVIDYRPSSYKGFIRTDEMMESLGDILGHDLIEGMPERNREVHSRIRSDIAQNKVLGGNWTDFDFDVPGLGAGGQFDISLGYSYSPFSSSVRSEFSVTRLVCANGMVTTHPIVLRGVPLINDYVNNLNIATSQLRPQFTDIMLGRFAEMANPNCRASVNMLKKTENFLSSCIGSEYGESDSSNSSHLSKLIELKEIVSPENHLSDVYTAQAMRKTQTSKSLDGHLTKYDLWNVVTEAASHYIESSNDSSSRESSLTEKTGNMISNDLVFEDFSSKKVIQPKPVLSDESDHVRAFFAARK